ncbi:Bug family tripartite tricarboxylate transporter substrate binding protein [Limnohabitans radicicola]|uniref:Tripartite tricarboxylate transporter substrate binding protein n=1 Tax=Limnohabitans radicicola TaxID=2771427 RepID=A0A927FHK6_9BURK|nr:tripartite tricarboxylate transporter substrate binding protein [Limnohabitans radicicola]MBD8050748.1 tripartite tricarboxylate transporter substrate binding protein [Limnohabitans radicicola]
MNKHTSASRRQWISALANAAALLASFSPPAHAQDWPGTRPLSWIVPYPPAGSTDVMARAIAQRVGASLGTTVVIDNKPGATGTIGGAYVAKASPDGTTALMTTIGAQAIAPHLMGKLPYDPLHDLEPVALVGTIPHLLVVAPSQPFKSVAELLAAGKARPGEIAFASGGNGTILQMQAELLAMRSGVRFLHVPYKGDTPALQDTLGAQVQFMFAPVAAAMPHVKTGKLRALAVTSATRLKVLPDVPTMAEAGQKDFVVEQWQGIYLPARTPPTTVQRLNAEINKALREPAVAELADKLGVTLVGGAPQRLTDTQNADSATWARVIRTANIKAD